MDADRFVPGTLDPLIHVPARLMVVALLDDAGELPFATVRAELAIVSGTLSAHLAVLEAAAYVQVTKGYVGKRPRTQVRLTPTGQDAWQAYRARLLRVLRPS